MEQVQKQTIHKDMMIGEVISKHPEKTNLLSEIMIDFGIHCVGCGAATFETLEEGVLGHGFSKQDLAKLVTDLNKAINSETPTKTTTKQITDFKLTLSKNAIEKVKNLMENEGKGKNILRVSVLAGGCSGYTYDLELIGNNVKEDLHFKQGDLQVSVERDSMEYLNGCEIDFVDSLKESGFKFNNPNSSKECGCGKSFS